MPLPPTRDDFKREILFHVQRMRLSHKTAAECDAQTERVYDIILPFWDDILNALADAAGF